MSRCGAMQAGNGVPSEMVITVIDFSKEQGFWAKNVGELFASELRKLWVSVKEREQIPKYCCRSGSRT